MARIVDSTEASFWEELANALASGTAGFMAGSQLGGGFGGGAGNGQGAGAGGKKTGLTYNTGQMSSMKKGGPQGYTGQMDTKAAFQPQSTGMSGLGGFSKTGTSGLLSNGEQPGMFSRIRGWLGNLGNNIWPGRF